MLREPVQVFRDFLRNESTGILAASLRANPWN
jgi:hypothetical protein